MRASPRQCESYESIVRRHLLPRFEATPLGSIDYPLVLTFISGLQQTGLGPGTVRNVRDVLRLILDLAVRSGAIKSNPVSHVEVARGRHAEMIFLDTDQIMTLAAEVTRPPPRYRRGDRRVGGYLEYGLLVRFARSPGHGSTSPPTAARDRRCPFTGDPSVPMHTGR